MDNERLIELERKVEYLYNWNQQLKNIIGKHIESTLIIAEKQHANTGAIYKDKQILRDNIKNIEKLKEM